jgi:hypothetical protein
MNAAIRSIVSTLIGSRFANCLALALPTGVPQLFHPYFSAYRNAFFALSEAACG